MGEAPRLPPTMFKRDDMKKTVEHQRLQDHLDHNANWKKWGPYVSERAWGTVREDYSADGSAWEYFPHDHARSRAYRWGEDGIAGICDRHQYVCFSLSLWNHNDPILKERLFGLTGSQGNHGEDVKEYYFYLDATPTNSYLKMLYKYPHAAFPYADMVAENGRRGFNDFEYELSDTGLFDDQRYFDVFVEYAKVDTDNDTNTQRLFYDTLHLPDGSLIPLKVRSPVGLMPLLAVETLEHDLIESLPVFKRRLNWFFENRVYLHDSGNVACVKDPGGNSRRLLSIVNRERLVKVLGPMLDEEEFLSPYGIRSVSKFHRDRPYTFTVDGVSHTIDYQPAESQSGLFGGNSNWRGPIWFPINYLLIESLQKYHHYYGDSLKVECPTGSGRMLNLGEVAKLIQQSGGSQVMA